MAGPRDGSATVTIAGCSRMRPAPNASIKTVAAAIPKARRLRHLRPLAAFCCGTVAGKADPRTTLGCSGSTRLDLHGWFEPPVWELTLQEAAPKTFALGQSNRMGRRAAEHRSGSRAFAIVHKRPACRWMQKIRRTDGPRSLAPERMDPGTSAVVQPDGYRREEVRGGTLKTTATKWGRLRPTRSFRSSSSRT